MKVLVVGASGFIGRALVDRLLEAGHEVEAWSRIAPPPRTGLVSRSIDLLSTADLPHPGKQPWDAAFHLAAHTVPGLDWNQQRILDNLVLTARVFDHLAATAQGCRAVFASTGLVYAPSEKHLDENSPLAGLQPYSISKLLGETWVLGRRNDLKVYIVRPFNLIGPGMTKSLLIPDLMERIQAGALPIEMKGRDDVRDFLDRRDAIDAFMHLLTTDAPSGRIWNLCSGIPTCVSSLVKGILRAKGMPTAVSFRNPAKEMIVGNPARLMADTGWKPRRTLDDIVSGIIAGTCGNG
ncbi:MAG: NAD(P)-dependent oxidoreductase [Holophaga sp.]|nr:NAD(P)-dependent oxidoreductase [Holophaga sp.]